LFFTQYLANCCYNSDPQSSTGLQQQIKHLQTSVNNACTQQAFCLLKCNVACIYYYAMSFVEIELGLLEVQSDCGFNLRIRNQLIIKCLIFMLIMGHI